MRHAIRATSYAEEGRRIIRESILGGRYEPGERLSEQEISRALGISRSPVRQAIHGLASEGLVTLVPQKGAFVTKFSLRRVRELYEVREALEVMAARLACERADVDELEGLRKIIRDTKSAFEGEEDASHSWDHAAYPWDLDFHRCVAGLAGNEKLAEEVEKTNQQLRLARSKSASQPLRARLAYEEHVRVCEAVCERDAALAEQRMRDHLRNACDSFEQAFLEKKGAAT